MTCQVVNLLTDGTGTQEAATWVASCTLISFRCLGLKGLWLFSRRQREW